MLDSGIWESFCRSTMDADLGQDRHQEWPNLQKHQYEIPRIILMNNNQVSCTWVRDLSKSPWIALYVPKDLTAHLSSSFKIWETSFKSRLCLFPPLFSLRTQKPYKFQAKTFKHPQSPPILPHSPPSRSRIPPASLLCSLIWLIIHHYNKLSSWFGESEVSLQSLCG